MARLELAITNIVDIFMEYAKKITDDHVLCKAELKELLQKEIESDEFKGRINTEDVNEAMAALDKNKDDEVNFREFCRCVTLLAVSCYRKKTGKVGKGKGKGKKGKGKGKGRRQGKGKGKGEGEGEDEDEDEDEGEGEGEDNEEEAEED